MIKEGRRFPLNRESDDPFSVGRPLCFYFGRLSFVCFRTLLFLLRMLLSRQVYLPSWCDGSALSSHDVFLPVVSRSEANPQGV